MPVRRAKGGRWRYRHVIRMPDGTSKRISGSAPRHKNSKAAAEEAMHDHIDRLQFPERHPKPRKEVPTFEEWFNGRFWREWVIARKNKLSEKKSKRAIFKNHLRKAFGELAIDEIDVAAIAEFRASLIEREYSDKSVNNILAVLSKPLRYAEDVGLIERAPRVGLLRAERPEIVAPDFFQYARLVRAAQKKGPSWHAAVILAGEAGLRSGEIKGLRWREDVDLIARTVTVNQQMLYGQEGTPKGRTRRTIPMTSTLYQLLRRLETIREGYVVRNLDGSPISDGQALHAMPRLCRLAGLPVHGWHWLRHGFGTHAAMFGVNPWTLMSWMGHKRIDETMRYVHVAHVHRRPLPPEITDAGHPISDPDERVLKMLGARVDLDDRGKAVAKTESAILKAV